MSSYVQKKQSGIFYLVCAPYFFKLNKQRDRKTISFVLVQVIDEKNVYVCVCVRSDQQ